MAHTGRRDRPRSRHTDHRGADGRHLRRDRRRRNGRPNAPAGRGGGSDVSDDRRLAITMETAGGVDVVRLRGELDLTNVDALAASIESSRAATVVLDLTLLLFVDSAGVRGIDAAHVRLAESGRRLLVVAPPASRAAWTFRIAGFADDFVLASLEDATERAGSSGPR